MRKNACHAFMRLCAHLPYAECQRAEQIDCSYSLQKEKRYVSIH